jgi:uncharacterized protein YkwD
MARILRIGIVGIVGIVGLAGPSAARAADSDLANGIRLRGCDGRPGEHTPLHPQARLDQAARRLALGAPLREALSASGYRATASASIRISGDTSRAALEEMLRSRFCAQLLDPRFGEIGAYRRGDALWVIAASPFVAPSPGLEPRVEQLVLAQVNEARAHGRRCGAQLFAPAAPLERSTLLERVALEHSRDMAAHDYLDHIGRDASTPAARASRAGYRWRVVGENIASGATTAAEVVEGWLASPEHCANIMDPRFTETAVAYAASAESTAGIYWTQMFAQPSSAPAQPSGRPAH